MNYLRSELCISQIGSEERDRCISEIDATTINGDTTQSDILMHAYASIRNGDIVVIRDDAAQSRTYEPLKSMTDVIYPSEARMHKRCQIFIVNRKYIHGAMPAHYNATGPREAAQRTLTEHQRQTLFTCTACGEESTIGTAMTHALLNIHICDLCDDNYDADFILSRKQDGLHIKATVETKCRWCALALVNLEQCSTCTYAFCDECLTRNLGQKEVDIAGQDGWQCPACMPTKLQSLRAEFHLQQKDSIITRPGIGRAVEEREEQSKMELQREEVISSVAEDADWNWFEIDDTEADMIAAQATREVIPETQRQTSKCTYGEGTTTTHPDTHAREAKKHTPPTEDLSERPEKKKGAEETRPEKRMAIEPSHKEQTISGESDNDGKEETAAYLTPGSMEAREKHTKKIKKSSKAYSDTLGKEQQKEETRNGLRSMEDKEATEESEARKDPKDITGDEAGKSPAKPSNCESMTASQRRKWYSRQRG